MEKALRGLFYVVEAQEFCYSSGKDTHNRKECDMALPKRAVTEQLDIEEPQEVVQEAAPEVIEEAAPAVETASEPEPELPSPVTVRSTTDLLEPFTFQRFPADIPVEAPELTSWMKAQVDAGLMVVY